ncbi:hypothetical protein B0T26DRAFT_866542 [Lasiosphaeria miniovina]|uniref:Uncharacterized protein n=1 Tax=Lasiosphaeria miniovina TaxID=1954250 RepID=A0AA40EAX4_9PEZI|nr:uncharacterized protein B0T26DRAFT_866542 [Lasiosphaeria miniovina]KAK0733235.1 hypothetical protein B0T26DRAFT_866542 [Lasiosphaeria miniovina]
MVSAAIENIFVAHGDTATSISAPPSTEDFVEDFFQHLPSVSDQHQFPHQIPLLMARAYPGMAKFLLDAKWKQSNDPDKEFLVRIVKEGLQNANSQYILQNLAALGLNSSVAADDKSIKASHLRYYKWVAQGRRDEDSPFEQSISIPHDTLPNDPNDSICGNCGDSGAAKKCLGLVPKGPLEAAQVRLSSAEAPSHLDVYFQPIFEHYLGSTYDTTIEKISEDNGVIHAKAQDGWDKRAAYQGKHIVTKFRHDLAPSKDAGTAVLMNGNCCQFVDFGKSLTGFFLKPEKVVAHLHIIAEASLLDPKNSPAFKLYFTPSFDIQTTTGHPGEYATFKKVWFTAREYNKYKNRPQLLKAMWKARLKAVGGMGKAN